MGKLKHLTVISPGGILMVMHPLVQGDPRVISEYVIQGRLGAGGMGIVYFSKTRGGRPVAIKTVRPDLAADPRFRKRFEHEVQAARQVRGNYIANVLDSNTEGPVPWLATEYISGVSLARIISAHGAVPLRTFLGVAAGVANALEDIHAVRIIHRDLKPGNIILTQNSLSVIDFGIARVLDSDPLTGANTRIGTPAFMAPEQIKGNVPTTSAADVFSLGLTIHVAATGRHPFEKELYAAIPYLQGGAPDLTACPPPLRALLGHCLAMNPAERPTATEVVALCQELGGRLGLTRVLPDDGWLPEEYTVVSISKPSHSSLPVGNIPVSSASTPAGSPVAPYKQWAARRKIAFGGLALALASAAVVFIYVSQDGANTKPQDGANTRPQDGDEITRTPDGDEIEVAKQCLTGGPWELHQKTGEPIAAHKVEINFTGSSTFVFNADGTGVRIDKNLKEITHFESVNGSSAWAPIVVDQDGRIDFRYSFKKSKNDLKLTFTPKEGKINRKDHDPDGAARSTDLKLNDSFFSCTDIVLTITEGGSGARSDSYTRSFR
ncbi:serine/threonine protein kinase [Streptomyces sp. NPDC059142]|uniref:serine/threonine protein kinase n=1 Tax=Streptomyces sp. NPDC059142 TaxID=3346739 RepID=UPI0036C66212